MIRRITLLLIAALCAALVAPPLPAAARPAARASLVANGGFEAGQSAPDGWAIDQFQPTASFTWDDTVAHSGRRSAKISAAELNDARWVQRVPVQPDTVYLLWGWIRTEDVAASPQSVQAGANLSFFDFWGSTPALLGTNDWTYVSMTFNSGPRSELTLAARLGYWSGVTTGTVWFDDIGIMPLSGDGPITPWKILTVIYPVTDHTYVDKGGVTRHVIARMSPTDIQRATEEARRFVEQDIPALTSGMMRPELTVRVADRPLTNLGPNGDGWWPDPGSTAPERDPAFDSVIVIWDPRATDVRTGQYIWIGSAAGLTPGMGTGQLYTTLIIEAAYTYGHRNVFKHEWGHSILEYFEAAGTAPKPKVENHAYAGQYVNCVTGRPYVWEDETDANPIPNSIYHNASGFTHDYYSGTTALASDPTRCLGVDRRAWALGGPVSKPEPPAAFPTTDLLDEFTRDRNGPLNGPPLGRRWAGIEGLGGYQVADGEVRVLGGGPIFWRHRFASDQEAYLTLRHVDQDGASQSLILKSQNNGSRHWQERAMIVVGYEVRGGAGRVVVDTYRPGQPWQTIGAAEGLTLRDGDQLGAEALRDGTVRVYLNGVELLSADAGPYFAGRSGLIGIWFSDAAGARIDDFGGGSLR